MSRTIFRYVLVTYALFFFGILSALVVIFLVAHFVDHAKAYHGEDWVKNVAILYLHRLVVTVRELAPAVLLLAAGATVSLVRKRGELTALKSLSFGPSMLYLPVAACALVFSLGLVAFDEFLATDSSLQIDRIVMEKFGSWGAWRTHFMPKQWFRRGNQIFYLRAGAVEPGYQDVTILRLRSDFSLEERLDAKRMVHVRGTVWRLSEVVDRRFDGEGQSTLESKSEADVDLDAPESAFNIRPGRPEQMRLPQLAEQVRARREAGQPSRLFSLAYHNRFAYSIAGLPAALLAVGLALRPGRKGHLITALVEGLVIALVLWGMMVVFKTLVLSERMSPPIAAWAPALVLVSGAFWVWMEREGGIRWKGL